MPGRTYFGSLVVSAKDVVSLHGLSEADFAKIQAVMNAPTPVTGRGTLASQTAHYDQGLAPTNYGIASQLANAKTLLAIKLVAASRAGNGSELAEIAANAITGLAGMHRKIWNVSAPHAARIADDDTSKILSALKTAGLAAEDFTLQPTAPAARTDRMTSWGWRTGASATGTQASMA